MGRFGERGISAAEMMGFPAGESKEWLFAPEVKVAQSCLTLCDPMNYAVHGILQARILEWVAIPLAGREKSHEQRSVVGYSPQGQKESDRT